MAYPKITLIVANTVFKPVGVEITAEVGHYKADVQGNVHSHSLLGALVAELMTTYFQVPEQRQSPDGPTLDTLRAEAFEADVRGRQAKEAGIL